MNFRTLLNRVHYPAIIWNDTDRPKMTEAHYNDLHADILAALLAHMPKTRDLKIRMTAIQDMTDDILEILAKELQ